VYEIYTRDASVYNLSHHFQYYCLQSFPPENLTSCMSIMSAYKEVGDGVEGGQELCFKMVIGVQRQDYRALLAL